MIKDLHPQAIWCLDLNDQVDSYLYLNSKLECFLFIYWNMFSLTIITTYGNGIVCERVVFKSQASGRVST